MNYIENKNNNNNNKRTIEQTTIFIFYIFFRLHLCCSNFEWMANCVRLSSHLFLKRLNDEKYICDRISQLIWLTDEFCFYVLCKHSIVRFDNFNQKIVFSLTFDYWSEIPFYFNERCMNKYDWCQMHIKRFPPRNKNFCHTFVQKCVNVMRGSILCWTSIHSSMVWFLFISHSSFDTWFVMHELTVCYWNFNAFRWRCNSSPLYKFSSTVLLRECFLH